MANLKNKMHKTITRIVEILFKGCNIIYFYTNLLSRFVCIESMDFLIFTKIH